MKGWRINVGFALKSFYLFTFAPSFWLLMRAGRITICIHQKDLLLSFVIWSKINFGIYCLCTSIVKAITLFNEMKNHHMQFISITETAPLFLMCIFTFYSKKSKASARGNSTISKTQIKKDYIA
jgi:hypothetical protein